MVIDDGGAEGTPRLSGKSPAGKANKLPCANFKKGSWQREILFFGMFLNVQNSKLQVDADSETSVHTGNESKVGGQL